MNNSNRNRICIPKFVRDIAKIKQGEEYYIIYETKNNCIFSPIPKGKILGKVKVIDKGRIFINKNIMEFFEDKRILIYYDYEKELAGVMFLDKDA